MPFVSRGKCAILKCKKYISYIKSFLMIIAFKHLSAEQVDTYGLVLSASGISYASRKGKTGWDIWVNETEYEKALYTVEQYLKENPDSHPPEDRRGHEYRQALTGLWGAAILLAFYVAITTSNNSEMFIRVYGSSAFHILRGELYRSVTALMIHADILHLAGNIVGIAIFGTAVCDVMGWGVGWLMILCTGIVGNLVNAVLYKTGHLSVGASTAVFGAIGLLAALQFLKKLKLPGERMKAWLPLGAGLALLSILGSGAHTDLTAHLFGFMAGILLGTLYGLLVKRAAASSYQTCCLLITVSLLVMSWMRTFGHG
jgi:membrane associated rhomboid family serine protease